MKRSVVMMVAVLAVSTSCSRKSATASSEATHTAPAPSTTATPASPEAPREPAPPTPVISNWATEQLSLLMNAVTSHTPTIEEEPAKKDGETSASFDAIHKTWLRKADAAIEEHDRQWRTFCITDRLRYANCRKSKLTKHLADNRFTGRGLQCRVIDVVPVQVGTEIRCAIDASNNWAYTVAGILPQGVDVTQGTLVEFEEPLDVGIPVTDHPTRLTMYQSAHMRVGTGALSLHLVPGDPNVNPPFRGKVVKRAKAGARTTYLKISRNEGSVWLLTSITDIPVGATVISEGTVLPSSPPDNANRSEAAYVVGTVSITTD